MIKVTDRHITMSSNDRFIGFEQDHNCKTIEFYISNKELSALHFKIDIENPQCTVTPEKELCEDGGVKLWWTVGNGITTQSGSLKIQLRAFDDAGNVVWHSESAELYIGKSIDVQKDYTDNEISDFEKIEQSVAVKLDEVIQHSKSADENAKNAEIYANQAKESSIQASQWASTSQNSAQNATNNANAAIMQASDAKATAQNALSMASNATSDVQTLAGIVEGKANTSDVNASLEDKADVLHEHCAAQAPSSSNLSVYDVTAYDDTESEAYMTHASKINDNEYEFSWFSWSAGLFKAGDIVSLTFESNGGNFWCTEAGIELYGSGTAVVENLVLTEPLHVSGSFGGVKIRVDKLVSGTDGLMSASDKKVLDDLPQAIDAVQANADAALSVAKQMNFAKGYNDYESLIAELNSAKSNKFKVGQSFLIVTLNVPDLWVSAIEEEAVPYTYVDDNTIVEQLLETGSVQFGYYTLSMLETLKQDLTNYVKNTDIATQSKPGIIKIGRGVSINSDGSIDILKAGKDVIRVKGSNYYPLVPTEIDLLVKMGLAYSDLKGNVLDAWTEQEKAAARELLGISNSYVLTQQDKQEIAEIVTNNIRESSEQ